jgi:hypothetical protein
VYRILPQRVDIFLFRGDVHLDLIAASFGRFDDTQVGRDCVVALCTPGDVVDVCELEVREKAKVLEERRKREDGGGTYGVDVKHGNIGRCHEQVLYK